MSKLVIVESPTKTKTLSKYLGKDYKVEASVGHVRDLPKKGLGVDVDHDFTPEYEIVAGKNKVVAKLRKEAASSSEVFLAMDPDREGEAIAWHIAHLLATSKKKLPPVRRVSFNEITEDAVKEAFEKPRIIDQQLVDAQQARRVLDRLVRYGLSAGRVQSVALRFVVEREKERKAFTSKPYWRLEARLCPKGKKSASFTSILTEYQGKPVEKKKKLNLFAGPYTYTSSIFPKESDIKKVMKSLEKKDFIIEKLLTKEKKLYPKPPFITSTLQQEASWRLGLTPRKTMRLAQNLYENGLITYMRTDSFSLSPKAVQQARTYIKSKYGQRYLPEKSIGYKTRAKKAQEAHEAIRPANVKVLPDDKKVKALGSSEARLYKLIWQRLVACQMVPAKTMVTEVKISSGPAVFSARGLQLVFDGFMKVYPNGTKEEILPELKEGQKLNCLELLPSEHETSRPPRYSEAGLIKELEKFEIGRPSTYASIIATLRSRRYVSVEDKQLIPEDVGMVVSDLLVDHFPDIVDIDFTAEMEEGLDKIAEGEKEWVPLVRDFYRPFVKNLENKEEELKKSEVTILEVTNKKCPECGKKMAVKLGKYGKFLSCGGWPDCKVALPLDEDGNVVKPQDIDEKCPKCGAAMVLKSGRFGKFLACSKYPDCKGTKQYLDKIEMKCPKCGKGEVIIKRTKKGRTFYGCSRYPDCDYASWKDPRPQEEKE